MLRNHRIIREIFEIVSIFFYAKTPNNLRRGDLPLLLSQNPTSLSGVQVKDFLILGLLDSFLSFGHDHLDVTRVGHVWVDLRKIGYAISEQARYSDK